MRRLLYGVFAASFLLGMMTGCTTPSSCSSCGSGGCGTSACSTGTCGTGTCGSTGCSTCGNGSCGRGGCADGGFLHHLNFICHTTGVCDCDRDEDPCAHRAPWASHPINYPTVAKAAPAPAASPFAPTEEQPVGAAPGAPQVMPTSNIRR